MRKMISEQSDGWGGTPKVEIHQFQSSDSIPPGPAGVYSNDLKVLHVLNGWFSETLPTAGIDWHLASLYKSCVFCSGNGYVRWSWKGNTLRLPTLVSWDEWVCVPNMLNNGVFFQRVREGGVLFQHILNNYPKYTTPSPHGVHAVGYFGGVVVVWFSKCVGKVHLYV